MPIIYSKPTIQNPIWDYFRRDPEKNQAQCLICQEWKIFKNHKYTTNLISHLSSKPTLHSEAFKEFNKKKINYRNMKGYSNFIPFNRFQPHDNAAV